MLLRRYSSVAPRIVLTRAFGVDHSPSLCVRRVRKLFTTSKGSIQIPCCSLSASNLAASGDVLDVESLEDDYVNDTTCEDYRLYESIDFEALSESEKGDESFNTQVLSNSFHDVTRIDQFSRARVLNYVKRLRGPAAGTDSTSIFEVQRVEGAGKELYHARLRLPFAAANYPEREAEGLGSTPKDAEYLAAMHAEAILNALAIPVYSLASSQERYARTVRANGSYAPFPNEPPRPNSIPSPPPLQLLSGHALGKRGRQPLAVPSDFSQYTPCCRSPILSSFHNAIVSPYILDIHSAKRVIQLILARGLKVKDCVCATTVPRSDPRFASGGQQVEGFSYALFRLQANKPEPSHASKSSDLFAKEEQIGEEKDYIFQIFLHSELGVPPELAPITCTGRAPTIKVARYLAFMHAELTLDALCLPIFTKVADLRSHCAECKLYGRNCYNPDEASALSNQFSPLKPLCFVESDLTQLVLSTDRDIVSPGVLTPLFDTDMLIENLADRMMLTHVRLLDELTLKFRPVSFVDEKALMHLTNYLEWQCTNGTIIDTSNVFDPSTRTVRFFIEHSGSSFGTVRCSMMLPTPNPALYGRRLVCGIARNIADAKGVCAMHALATLEMLQISSYPDQSNPGSSFDYNSRTFFDEMRSTYAPCAHYNPCERERILLERSRQYSNGENPTPRAISTPPPFKLVDGRTAGRVRFVVTSEEEAAEWGNRRSRRLTEEEHQAAVEAARLTTRPQSWNLRPDAFVDPPVPSAEYLSVISRLEGCDALLPTKHSLVPRILVPPSDEARSASRTFLHTLNSVRNVDARVVARLLDYLERNGRSDNSFLRYTFSDFSEEGGKIQMYCVIVPLPVPENLAPLFAVGEAPSPDEAIQCAALHAELVLDDAGIQLYDHRIYQRTHAECACSNGRWAPLPETTPVSCSDGKRNSPSPPAVRMLSSSSKMWSLVKRHPLGTLERFPVGCMLSHEEYVQTPYYAHEGSTTSVLLANNSKVLADVTESEEIDHFDRDDDEDDDEDSNSAGNVMPADDEALDLSRYTVAVTEQLSLSITTRVRQYFFSKHALFKTDRWSSIPPGRDSGRLHFASTVVPVPPEYGIRIARGCGMSKREAHLLCVAHAEKILAELGLPIYQFAQQQERYYFLQKQKGVNVPRWGTQPMLPSTVTSFGLKMTHEIDPDLKPPAPFTGQDPEEWARHCNDCRSYLQKSERNNLLIACQDGHPPLCGITLEDEAMVESKRHRVDRHSLTFMRKELTRLGFAIPQTFSPIVVKTKGGKMFYCAALVSGTPYTVRALNSNRVDAINAASMHYLQIAIRIAALSVDGVSTGAVQASSDSDAAVPAGHLWDPVRQQPTARGRRMAVHLFSRLLPPHRGVRESVVDASVPGESAAVTATVRYDDDTGLKQYAKSTVAVQSMASRERSVQQALDNSYSDVCAQLRDKRPQFADILFAFKAFPAMAIETAQEFTFSPLQLSAALTAISPRSAAFKGCHSDLESLTLRRACETILSAASSESVPTRKETDSEVNKSTFSVLEGHPIEYISASLLQRAPLSTLVSLQHMNSILAEEDNSVRVSVNTLVDILKPFVVSVSPSVLGVMASMHLCTSAVLRADELATLAEEIRGLHHGGSNIVHSEGGTGVSRSLSLGRQHEISVAMPTPFGVLVALVSERLSRGANADFARVRVAVNAARLLILGAVSGTYRLAVAAVCMNSTQWGKQKCQLDASLLVERCKVAAKTQELYGSMDRIHSLVLDSLKSLPSYLPSDSTWNSFFSFGSTIASLRLSNSSPSRDALFPLCVAIAAIPDLNFTIADRVSTSKAEGDAVTQPATAIGVVDHKATSNVGGNDLVKAKCVVKEMFGPRSAAIKPQPNTAPPTNDASKKSTWQAAVQRQQCAAKKVDPASSGWSLHTARKSAWGGLPKCPTTTLGVSLSSQSSSSTAATPECGIALLESEKIAKISCGFDFSLLQAEPSHGSSVQVSVSQPLTAFLLSSPAVSSRPSEGLNFVLLNGYAPLYSRKKEVIEAVMRMQKVISDTICTAEPWTEEFCHSLSNVIGTL